jgi:hypothetical protein
MAPLPEDPDSGVICPVLATPRRGSWGSGVCRVGSCGVISGRLEVKSYPSISAEGDKKYMCGLC